MLACRAARAGACSLSRTKAPEVHASEAFCVSGSVAFGDVPAQYRASRAKWARHDANRLADSQAQSHGFRMFMVSKAEAAAIRRAYEEDGEFAAAVELRRYFPGIADNANARLCA